MQPRIRTGLLINYLPTVLALGGDADEVLRLADVGVELFESPDSFIPYATYLKLLSAATTVTRRPDFGLEMSRPLSAVNLGVTGFLMSQAETVGEGWRSLERFYHVHDTFGFVGLHQRGETAFCSYTLPSHSLPALRQAADIAAGIMLNVNLMLYGPEFKAQILQLPYAEPDDISPFQRLNVEKIIFDQASCAMGFPASFLSAPVIQRDPRMHHILVDYLSTVELSDQHAASRQVEGLIRQFLSSGQCTIEQLARFMSVSVRTLQNRLSAEHTSFQLILEKVRRELAINHLTSGDMRLSELAYLLGYSEPSAFSRSFKRWFGRSPREWKKEPDHV